MRIIGDPRVDLAVTKVLTCGRAEAAPHVAVWTGNGIGDVAVNACGPGFDLYASDYPEGTRIIVNVWIERHD